MIWKISVASIFLLPLALCLHLLYKLIFEKRAHHLVYHFYAALCSGLIYAFVFSRFDLPYTEVYLGLAALLLLKSFIVKNQGEGVKQWKYGFAFLTLLASLSGFALEYKDTPEKGYNIGTPISDADLGSLEVFKGGVTILYNHHKVVPRQRWALDIAQKVGLPELLGVVQGDPTLFRVFGKSVVSPCNGEVVTSSSELPDQAPGIMNEVKPEGNSVEILCTGTDGKKYLFRYAHLKNGSVSAKAGDLVGKGSVFAKVGNSGNSAWPHLHVDLIDQASGEAIPIFINSHFLRGGDLIRPGL